MRLPDWKKIGVTDRWKVMAQRLREPITKTDIFFSFSFMTFGMVFICLWFYF